MSGIISVGFCSKHWSYLKEATDKDIEFLIRAFGSGNQTAMFHTKNAIDALNENDMDLAIQQAEEAVEAAKQHGNKKYQVDCPFCNDGVIEIEYSRRSDPYGNSKKVAVTCEACKGGGVLNVADYYSEYADDSYPEEAIRAIFNKDYDVARKIAQAARNAVEQHQHSIEEESLEKHLG